MAKNQRRTAVRAKASHDINARQAKISAFFISFIA
jgi:hypothetical protein